MSWSFEYPRGFHPGSIFCLRKMQLSSSSSVISAKWFGYGSTTQMSLNACVYITE